jgi:predicted dehydrogenase
MFSDTLAVAMSQLDANRREFLQATAGSAMMSALASSAVAEDESPPITVGVIGTGGRGCDLIRALTTITTCRVVAVCDDYGPHLERGWQYAGPLAQSFTDYRRLIDEQKPQAIVIAVPLDLHHEVATAAVESGAAVFCEKMMCYGLDQAERLAKLVVDKIAVFQIGLQKRANAIYRQAAAMVQTGMLGRITAIKVQWNRNSDWRRPVPVPQGHADFASYDRRLNWRLYRDRSRGLLAELGSHQLDIANWMLGTHPTRVIGTGGIDYWRDGRDVPDNVHCVYEYVVRPPVVRRNAPALPPGVDTEPYTVRVHCSSVQNNAYEGASELILGTQGTLFLSQKKGLLFREQLPEEIPWAKQAEQNAALIASGKTLKLANDPWAHRGPPFEIDAEGDDTRDQLVSFLDHVRSGDRQTLCTAADGLVNTATVLMGHQAVDTMSAVPWPLGPDREASGM